MTGISAGRWGLIGLLLVGVTAVSPAQAAHPLITEDTSTQGVGRHQLEVLSDWGRDKEAGVRTDSHQFSVVWSHGIHERADVIITLPYLRERRSGAVASRADGIGDIGLDLKWRFFESGAWSLMLKPGVTLPTGEENDGLGTGRVTYGAYLALGYDVIGWTLNWHIGHRYYRNQLGLEEHLHHASFAVTRKTGAWRLVADIGVDTNTDPLGGSDPAYLVLGASHAFNESFDISFGLKQALTSAETDHTLLVGLAFRF
jgi:hypothetical protein